VILASHPLPPAKRPVSRLNASSSISRSAASARFGGPLFSYSYELLFPQPVCFDIHLNCPGVYSCNVQTFRRSDLQTVCNSFRCHTYKITLLQVLSLPHIQKTGGWGSRDRDLRRPCTEARESVPVSPFPATLTHSHSRNRFVCHSYENTRDGYATAPAKSKPSLQLCPDSHERKRPYTAARPLHSKVGYNRATHFTLETS